MPQYNITEMPKLFDMKHRYTCNYHQVRPVEAKMPLNFNLLSFLLWKVLFVLKKKRGKNVNSMRVLPPSFYVIDLETIIRRI